MPNWYSLLIPSSHCDRTKKNKYSSGWGALNWVGWSFSPCFWERWFRIVFDDKIERNCARTWIDLGKRRFSFRSGISQKTFTATATCTNAIENDICLHQLITCRCYPLELTNWKVETFKFQTRSMHSDGKTYLIMKKRRKKKQENINASFRK